MAKKSSEGSRGTPRKKGKRMRVTAPTPLKERIIIALWELSLQPKYRTDPVIGGPQRPGFAKKEAKIQRKFQVDKVRLITEMGGTKLFVDPLIEQIRDLETKLREKRANLRQFQYYCDHPTWKRKRGRCSLCDKPMYQPRTLRKKKKKQRP